MNIVSVVVILIGFAALVGGAEFLVKGSKQLALAFGISPLVVGLTVVAFGTSAPETTVGVFAAIAGRSSISVGNVIGSNIFNILFVLGLSAIWAPLIVSQQVVRLEAPIMIGASVLLFLLAQDGTIGKLDGAILFTGILFYTVWAINRSRREQKEVTEEYEAEFGPHEIGDRKASTAKNIGWAAAGLLLLVAGSRLLVIGAVAIARSLNVGEVVIGLTIVAIGTSLPELATSLIAGLRGERDIAVGNAVGSNLFNILAVFGLTGLAAPGGVSISQTTLGFDMPVMIAVAVAVLPIFFSGHRISRWEGALMFVSYWLYLAAVVHIAT